MRKLSLALALCLALLASGWIMGCGSEPAPPAPVAPPPEVESAPMVAPPAEPPVETSPAAEPTSTVTIYRTRWGVPHIYAETASDAAYGLGYAQAEDRLDDIYRNARMAMGAMSEVFGKEHIQQDYMIRVFRNAEMARKAYEEAPENLRIVMDRFTEGILAYVAEHPERKPDYAIELEPWHCAAIGRTMIMQWPIGTIMSDLRRGAEQPPRGSNGWAVSPSRTADGCAILLTDPHLSWRDIQVFYEARVKGGELDMAGHMIAGSPLVALGHNANVGWACTTGGPDTSDVYEMKIDKENPLRYEYDGEWRDAELVMIAFDVKDGDAFSRPAVYTHLGPFVDEPDMANGTVHVGATPYLDSTGLFEQMYRMNTAADCDAFYQALGMNEFMEQNLIFADRKGNIQYVRTGRVPIRPDGYDWSRPVPGLTSETKWLGLHDIADLVQIRNPEQGFMQNCNISPAVMMPDSPLTPDKYKPYIYNVSWDSQNPRGIRSLQLLEANDAVTTEDAIAIAMDVYDILAKPWQAALRKAVEGIAQDQMQDETLARKVKEVLDWNGEFTVDSPAAPIVMRWRLKCQGKIDTGAIADGEPLQEMQQIQLVKLFAETLEENKSLYGDIDVKWGDMYLVGRGDIFVGCDGADFGSKGDKTFTETLRDVVGGEQPAGSGKYVARSGSIAMMLMFMRPDGVESYTSVPWGQSSDPESPHYMDQGRELYGRRRFKPTLFAREELLASPRVTEKVLAIP